MQKPRQRGEGSLLSWQLCMSKWKRVGGRDGIGVRELRRRLGGQGSEVIAAVFLDKETTSPSLLMDTDEERSCFVMV